MDWKIGARFYRVIFNNHQITRRPEALRHKNQRIHFRCDVKILDPDNLSLSRQKFLVRLSWCLVCCFIGGYLFSNIADWDLTILTILSTSKFSPGQNTGETKHLDHNIDDIILQGGPDTMEGSQKGRRITD